jgi:hypothetical protein
VSIKTAVVKFICGGGTVFETNIRAVSPENLRKK